MKTPFNAICDFCERRRPRCAYIRLCSQDRRMKICGLSVACEDCREKLKGRFFTVRRPNG